MRSCMLQLSEMAGPVCTTVHSLLEGYLRRGGCNEGALGAEAGLPVDVTGPQALPVAAPAADGPQLAHGQLLAIAALRAAAGRQ